MDETAESYEEDIDNGINRHDVDGKGGAVVPKGDFVSYETDEVDSEGEVKEN